MAKKVDAKELKEKALKNSKGFFGEFKAFVLRGNVMDMAVGVIIGSAFASIVTALTTDFINPLINSIGGAEIGGSIHLPWTPEGEAGQYLLWGDFVTSVINFLIMAFVLFIMLKVVNKVMTIGKKKVEEEKKVAEPSEEVKLLTEIRDALKKKK
ncbi:MAG: large conductance mechanosensitive channel protein MscL [Bacilli bacterium]|nr:large conductance mechanosensitive channel protein MscL [Bacilli bacterium]